MFETRNVIKKVKNMSEKQNLFGVQIYGKKKMNEHYISYHK